MPKLQLIEIFRAGRHTPMQGGSLDFSEADLAASAAAYDPGLHEAPLVVGHPQEDAPAYGWVRRLWAEGGSLKAATAQLDAAFAELVGAGRYKKVSASFYRPDAPNNPKPGVYYLRHVGFLGAMPPAVKGLAPVQFAGGDEECVTVEFGEGDTAGIISRIVNVLRRVREWVIERDGREVADNVIPAWELDWAAEDATRVRVEADPDPAFIEPTQPRKETTVPDSPVIPDKAPEKDGRQPGPVVPDAPALHAEFAERLAKLEEREAALAAQQRKADAARIVDAAVASGRLTGAQVEGLAEFMAALPDDTTVSFGEGGAAKTMPSQEFVRTFLARLPVQVDFAERSAMGGGDSADGLTADELADRAVAFRERQSRDGIVVTTTEAVAAVKAGRDK